MTYVAPSRNFLKNRLGTDSDLIAAEFIKIDTEIDTSRIRYADLTASMVSGTNLAGNGVDIAAGGSAVTYYALFAASQAMTILGMITYTTEAYVKDTTDAKIELKTEAGSPVTKCSYTFPVAGQAVKTTITTAPVDAALAAGDFLDMVVTMSGVSSGTGHAKVYLKYMLN